jgi:hypothetical protein
MRETLARVLHHLLLHGKCDALTMAKHHPYRGPEAEVLAAAEYGLDTGLLRSVWEVHNRPSLAANPVFEAALAHHLLG